MQTGVQIRIAQSTEDLSAVRELFLEYWNSFGFTPCFQGFEAEVASLPAKYALPRGRLLLATVDGEPAGCVALRCFDAMRGEMKRMYVRPRYRGIKLGQALLKALILEAREAGYAELLADTIPGSMPEALAMYERSGFERIPPYSNETPEAQHLRLRLL
ncbi:MAG: GNAT family N-acetyltransferase [Bryobacteraceae bacterium]